MNEELLRAVDLALDDKWDAAHKIVQDLDGNRAANWIHAVLHKIEGDRGNSMYWYRRADKTEFADYNASVELQAIKNELQ